MGAVEMRTADVPGFAPMVLSRDAVAPCLGAGEAPGLAPAALAAAAANAAAGCFVDGAAMVAGAAGDDGVPAALVGLF